MVNRNDKFIKRYGILYIIVGLGYIILGIFTALSKKPFFNSFSFYSGFLGLFLLLVGYYIKNNFPLGDKKDDNPILNHIKTKSLILRNLKFIIYLKEVFILQIFRRRLKKKYDDGLLNKYKKEKEKWKWTDWDADLIDKYAIGMVLFFFFFLIITDILLYFNITIEFKLIIWFIILIGALRIFDIIVYHLYALIVTKGQDLYDARRMVALLFLNYFEVLLWFALFYRFVSNWFLSNTIESFFDSLYFSIVTMTTLGYGDIRPNCISGEILISIHTLIGLLILLIMLARFIPALGLIKQKKCNKCKIYNDVTAKFCVDCGNKFSY